MPLLCPPPPPHPKNIIQDKLDKKIDEVHLTQKNTKTSNITKQLWIDK